MRITVAQLPQVEAALVEAWNALETHVVGSGAEAVVLPEMPFARWLASSRTVDSRAWADAATAHERWSARAAALGPPVAYSSPVIDASGEHRNRGCVAADGVVKAVHDKVYLPDEPGYWEASWYAPGPNRFEPFALGAARAGMLICTEMWFFERAHDYGRAGVQLLVVPRATPRESVDKWIAGGRAAAVVAGAYCVSANPWERAGTESDLAGVGWIIDPDGEVLAATDENDPFVTLGIELDRADAAKSTYPRYVRVPE